MSTPLIWRHRREKGFHQIVGCSPLTGDIKEFGRTFLREDAAERFCRRLNNPPATRFNLRNARYQCSQCGYTDRLLMFHEKPESQIVTCPRPSCCARAHPFKTREPKKKGTP